MPKPDGSPAPPPLKDWFDEPRHRFIARELAALSPGFRAPVFLDRVLTGLGDRSLMERLHQCATATQEALPGSYRQQVRVLQKLAPRLGHEFVAIFPCDFVATFGLEDFDFSLEALRFLTRHGSAEFAVRPFLAADQRRALATMQAWTADADEKVRRLASEGTRPRLPWGTRLHALVRDPQPCAAILEALKDDDSTLVRRSVANHLNDITKDHPEWVLQRLEGWDLQKTHLRWIARHACRTLIKRGNGRALALFGFGSQPAVKAALVVSPRQVRLGQRIRLETSITSSAPRAQRLAVDYVIHYVKARGPAFGKVFKWAEIDLPARSTATLSRNQLIRDFTTRQHHPGHHRVELQVNGARVAAAGFDLA